MSESESECVYLLSPFFVMDILQRLRAGFVPGECSVLLQCSTHSNQIPYGCSDVLRLSILVYS